MDIVADTNLVIALEREARRGLGEPYGLLESRSDVSLQRGRVLPRLAAEG